MSERGPTVEAVVGVTVFGRVEEDVGDVEDACVEDVVDEGATVVVGLAVVVVVGGK